jgi:hypothetical protein
VTDGRALDEATGSRADVDEITALLDACLRRLHAVALDAGAEPATTWRPEDRAG